MATPQVLEVLTEARAAVADSHRLRDEMRILRLQMRQNLTAVRDSAFTLKSNLCATAAGAAKGDVSMVRLAPVAPLAEPILFESQTPAVGLPEPPHPRPLDPKDQASVDLLTPREIQVLRLIGEGQRTKEIAFTLGITFKTAVTHRSNIMEKLGIHEGPRLVRFAIRTGIATA